jgi:hypothetical protein
MTVNIVKTKFTANIKCFKADNLVNDKDAKEIEVNIWVMTK